MLTAAFGCTALAQDTIVNGRFENWGNTVPSGDTHTEPTNWYSNQSGSSIAALGGQTCFKDSTTVHSGRYSVRVETITGPFSTIINGNVTTGVVDAPSITKSDGYIGTVNYSTATDIRHMAFTGRPDSLVGWYQYTSGGTGEVGKIRAILHTGEYYDPETPTTYHPDPTANKVADLTFNTPAASVSTWTRFSMPFTYVGTGAPAYIMINMTSSANQATTVSGSKFWVDDLQVVYNTSHVGVQTVTLNEDEANVYSFGNTVCVKFYNQKVKPSTITLTDVTGKQVFSAQITTDEFSSYQLSNLKPGNYIYRLNNSDFSKTGKLFIE